MSEWQLGLRIHDDVVDPLRNLLNARAQSVHVENEGDGVLLVANFEGTSDPIIMDAVGSWLLNLNAGESKIYTRRHSNDSWSKGWRAVLGSFQASARIWVVPAWDEAPKEASNVLYLESSLAFGIGGHPTTRGMLNVLDRLIHDDPSVQTVLDVGSGSGILALAAGRLGVQAWGIEPDEDASAEGLRNLERNALNNRVTLRSGRLQSVNERYDIVAANLYPATLRNEREDLLRCTEKHLIVSGFYNDTSGEIRSHFSDLDVVEHYSCEGWSVLHLKRTTSV